MNNVLRVYDLTEDERELHIASWKRSPAERQEIYNKLLDVQRRRDLAAKTPDTPALGTPRLP